MKKSKIAKTVHELQGLMLIIQKMYIKTNDTLLSTPR